VRQGQDTSLRSLQMWADLARKLGPSTLSSPVAAGIVSHAHDPFEKLLMAQRQVVDELVATQRQLTRQLLDATATAGGNPVAR
jgi:uroporphyrinogen-III decarboxylase